MKSNNLKIALTICLAILVNNAFGQIYNADFSNEGDGFADHTTSSPPAAGPISVGPFGSVGNQWSLSYTSTPGTDGTANSFKVVAGSLVSDDWGGQGIFQSQSIDVSLISSIDISAITINSGANDNEFKYFYILDGGSRVETANITSSDGDNVNYSITVDVSGATSIVVGFEFEENGGDSGYSTSSFTVAETPAATPGITLGTVSNNTIEDGTTATFTAVLNAEPATNVVLDLNSSDTGEVTLNLSQLTFTNGNWDTPQTVIATGVNDAIQDGNITVTITVSVNDASSDDAYDSVADVTTTIINEDDELPSLVINEILADPDGATGDANGDGTVDTGDDEFIELYNSTGISLDISGYKLSDGVGVKHIFTAGTIIPINGTIVVFGGGNINNFTNIAGLVQIASTGSLSLNNGGDTITIVDVSDVLVVTETYDGTIGTNQSIARSPDFTGSFIDHSTIGTNTVDFSPGKDNTDNSPFIKTWTGATNNVWATTSNWLENDVPGASDNAIIRTGTATYPTASSAPVSINSLIIESGATLISTNTFSGDVTYNRVLTNGGQWYLMSSPVIGETFNAAWATSNAIPTSNLDTDNIGISYYDNTSSDPDDDDTGPDTATGHWRYLQTDNSNSANFNGIGKGYSLIRSGSGMVSFTGSGIYTASQTPGITQGASNNFNLIGNPFTAYLNLGDFFADNNGTIISGATAWFWNGNSYDTKLSGTDNSFEIAPGQGFFVEAAASTNVTFDITDVTHQGTETFQKNARPEIKLFISDGANSRYAKMYFIDGTTPGYDVGYDGKLFGGITHNFAIYSHLVHNDQGVKYQVQSLPNSDYEEMIIPIGVIANSGKEITFTAQAMNLPAGTKVFLEDKVTNTIKRLDEANATYKVILTEAANGISRFYLHTKESSVLSTTDVPLESISIYKKDNNTLRITGLTKGKVSVKLYNLLGKEVLNTTFSTNGVSDVRLPNIASGIYVVQLKNEQGSINKKITLD